MFCEYCGKEITKKSHKKGGIQRFCSVECYYKSTGKREKGKPKYITCHYCGKTFKETRDRPNLFCSNTCSNKWYGIQRTEDKLKRAEHKKELRMQLDELIQEQKRINESIEQLQIRIENEKECKICGKIFIAKSKSQKCCSPECSRKNENWNKDKRIYRNGVPDLSITLTRLYMRDGGICQLCGRHIDFDCDPNSDYYPSIDHIKPISKGGLHQWDNVQLACRVCNTLKRDKIPAPI